MNRYCRSEMSQFQLSVISSISSRSMIFVLLLVPFVSCSEIDTRTASFQFFFHCSIIESEWLSTACKIIDIPLFLE